MSHADLVAAIDQLSAPSWRGRAYRHVAANRSPLSGEGARVTGGRWNPRGSFAALYLGLTEAAVVAEFQRLARRQGLVPESFLPRAFYTYEVVLQSVLDLRTTSNCSAVGLDATAIKSDDLGPCQGVGSAALTCGLEAVLAPSAAGQGEVLAVFIGALHPGSYVHDIASELWESAPPADRS